MKIIHHAIDPDGDQYGWVVLDNGMYKRFLYEIYDSWELRYYNYRDGWFV